MLVGLAIVGLLLFLLRTLRRLLGGEPAEARRIAAEIAAGRLDGPIEVDYHRQGGILPAVLRRIARESSVS